MTNVQDFWTMTIIVISAIIGVVSFFIFVGLCVEHWEITDPNYQYSDLYRNMESKIKRCKLLRKNFAISLVVGAVVFFSAVHYRLSSFDEINRKAIEAIKNTNKCNSTQAESN